MRAWADAFFDAFLLEEADGFLAGSAGNYLLQAYKGATTNKQNVGGIDRGEFLMGMLAPALRRHIRDRPFQNLQ